MNCISYSKTEVNKKKGFKMFFLMEKSKGASKTNLIFNVCICAIKSLHMYRLCVSTCISLLTNTNGCEHLSILPGCAVPCLGKYVQMEHVVCASTLSLCRMCSSHRDTGLGTLSH